MWIYCYFFYGMPISKDTIDWGSFGSYFGGMISFISIVLLYSTLHEQRKENHRNWFDAGFNRRIKALQNNIEIHQEFLHNLSNLVLDTYRHSPYDDECDQEYAKREINNMYVNNQTGRKDATENIFFQFKSTVEYIASDSTFDNHIKENYIIELEQSLRKDANVLIVCIICEKNDLELIGHISKYRGFLHFQSGNSGFDNLKNALFRYNKEIGNKKCAFLS